MNWTIGAIVPASIGDIWRPRGIDAAQQFFRESSAGREMDLRTLLVYTVGDSSIPGSAPLEKLRPFWDLIEALDYANSFVSMKLAFYVAVFDPANRKWPSPFKEYAP